MNLAVLYLMVEHNPEGIVQVKFEDAKAAEECIKLMNGRFFAGRELECFYWDGKTNYRVVRESLHEETKRIEQFGDMIEQKTSVRASANNLNIDALMDQLIGSGSDGEDDTEVPRPDGGDKTPEHPGH